MSEPLIQLAQKLQQQLSIIYEDIPLSASLHDIAETLIATMRLDQEITVPEPFHNNWTQQDVVLITYADSMLRRDEKPLTTLKNFIDKHIGDSINSVHILPFFPYSSDDGFAVIDYSSVNEAMGDWSHIQKIAENKKLMADLVINHCSSRSRWFENFCKGGGPGHDFFFTASPEDDLSAVIRPRTSPLLRPTETANGTKYVWCTFSHDQVDLDFRNPAVLEAFVKIIRLYLDMGITIFRLDAVAFLWKEVGSESINLYQTHEIIRLLRTLIEHARPDAVIITETNIPNLQNLTYFGNANEAHCIYNFSLPPLLVNTLVTGNCLYLKRWLMSMPPAQDGTTYFNFIASHDGIGLRPAEGLLSDEELGTLVNTMQQFGGRTSWRATPHGQQKAYEINISLFDALQGTTKGPDKWNFKRFICAHAIMLGMEGIPGIYIHSMLGTRNDEEKVKLTHSNRSINRHRWNFSELEKELSSAQSPHKTVLLAMKQLINLRTKQPAFHPNATKFVLHLGLQLFGYWRQSQDRRQSVFCVYNVTDQPQNLALGELNLTATHSWRDLIEDTEVHDLQANLTLSPYQVLWLSNK